MKWIAAIEQFSFHFIITLWWWGATHKCEILIPKSIILVFVHMTQLRRLIYWLSGPWIIVDHTFNFFPPTYPRAKYRAPEGIRRGKIDILLWDLSWYRECRSKTQMQVSNVTGFLSGNATKKTPKQNHIRTFNRAGPQKPKETNKPKLGSPCALWENSVHNSCGPGRRWWWWLSPSKTKGKPRSMSFYHNDRHNNYYTTWGLPDADSRVELV